MARRNRDSFARDLFDIAAMLPWWAGVALAIASYLVFGWIASANNPVTASSTGDVVRRAGISGFATVAQTIFPIALLAGAAASAIGRRKRSRLAATVATNDSPSIVAGLSWREYEILVGEAFRLQGYSIVETGFTGGGGAPDGGFDLVLRRGGETHLVQCKHWRAMKVGVTTVRELYGVITARGATRGFIVTSGSFTPDAVAFARGINADLIDGPRLREMLRRARAWTHSSASTSTVFQETPRATDDAPACPRCGKPMVHRVAGRGDKAGQSFWGCRDFPKCRGTRAV